MATLREHVQAAIAKSKDDATPQEIAQAAADAMNEVEAKKFLAEMLVATVSECIRNVRNSALNEVCGKGDGAPQPRSPKLDARKQMWNRLLEAKVRVGENRYKPMADCTVRDLQFCISDRKLLIGRVTNQIANYELLVDAMRKHRASTVGALPPGSVALI
ncbi:hypothetical protein B5566_02700 [Mycobacterium sp. MHSD3]|nr:hypothetical protein B5566_02700 [Mycobacterium sp. MHSD3]